LYHRHDADPRGSQVWLVDIEGREDREIVSFGPNVRCVATWFADAERVLVLVTAPTHERAGLYDPRDGSMRWLAHDPDRVGEGVLPSHDGRAVMLIEAREARVGASLLDLASGRETPVPPTDASLMPVGALPGGDWIGVRYGSTAASEIVRFSPRDPAAARSLT